MLEPPLPIVQTRHQLLPALSTRTTSSYRSPFQFLISSHFTHPGKLWFNFTIVVITVESGTAQLISATTLNSVCLTGIKPNKGALRQEKTLQVWVWIFTVARFGSVHLSYLRQKRDTYQSNLSKIKQLFMWKTSIWLVVDFNGMNQDHNESQL